MHAIPFPFIPTAAGRSLVVFDPAAQPHYSLDTVARLAGISRHRVILYCRYGLIHPIGEPDEAGWLFDADAISALHRLEQLRTTLDLNLPATRLFMEMSDELEHLRREVRFLREL